MSIIVLSSCSRNDRRPRPQSLDLLLDTGSADVVVITTACTTCSSSISGFNTSESSTLQVNSSQPLLLAYGAGNVTGTVFNDMVTLGPYTVPNQTFVGITQGMSGLFNGTTGGILGLAFQNASYSGAVPFVQALIDAGELSKPEMSFYLARNKDAVANFTSLDHHPGGTLTLGGINGSLYKGDIEYQPLANGSRVRLWHQTVSGELSYRSQSS